MKLRKSIVLSSFIAVTLLMLLGVGLHILGRRRIAHAKEVGQNLSHMQALRLGIHYAGDPIADSFEEFLEKFGPPPPLDHESA